MDVVTTTNRPQSVLKQFVIEDFGGVYVLLISLFEFSAGVKAFVIGLSQI